MKVHYCSSFSRGKGNKGSLLRGITQDIIRNTDCIIYQEYLEYLRRFRRYNETPAGEIKKYYLIYAAQGRTKAR